MAGTKSINKDILETSYTTRENLKKNTEDDSASGLEKSMNEDGLKSIAEIEEILDFAKDSTIENELGETSTTSDDIKDNQNDASIKTKTMPQGQTIESSIITENGVLNNVEIVQKGDNAVLQNVEIIRNDDNTYLDKVEIVEKNELKDVAVRTQPTNTSPKQEFEEKNKGHYEKKAGAFLFWGFVVCCCVVSAPLGGGFALVFVPPQAASFGLCVFWKGGEKKVWVIDEVSNPGDKLVSSHNIDTLVNKLENQDALVNPEKNSKELLANLFGNGDPKAMEDFENLISILDKLSENETKGFGENVLNKFKEIITNPENIEVIQDPKIVEAVKNMQSTDQNDEIARQKSAEELVKATNEVMAKTPGFEDLRNSELKNEAKLDETKQKEDENEEKIAAQKKKQEEVDKKINAFQNLKSDGLKNTDLPKSSKNNTRSPGM